MRAVDKEDFIKMDSLHRSHPCIPVTLGLLPLAPLNVHEENHVAAFQQRLILWRELTQSRRLRKARSRHRRPLVLNVGTSFASQVRRLRAMFLRSEPCVT
jgi:hypothetical protein